jgi:hypothetical protein
MKMFGGAGEETHGFLTLTLVGGEWSPSYLGRFTPVGSNITLFNNERRAHCNICVYLFPLNIFEPVYVI